MCKARDLAVMIFLVVVVEKAGLSHNAAELAGKDG